MKKETTRIDEKQFADIAGSIGLNPNRFRFLKYSQNFIYACDESSVILRLTSDCHRTKRQIQSELEWIDYLKINGVDACNAVGFGDGEKVKSIEAQEDILHCVLFKKAMGVPISHAVLGNETSYLHGQLVGKIHRITKSYPKQKNTDRFEWNENRLYTSDPAAFLPEEAKRPIQDIIGELIEHASKFPKNSNTYGLIHFDLHYNNIQIDGKTLSVFDFDNCSLGYLVNDIAKAIYSSVFTYHRRPDLSGNNPFFCNAKIDLILEDVWRPFWEGYKSENSVRQEWYEQIPLFFELIHIKEFVHHHRHGTPLRSKEMVQIFALEKEQILDRELPVCFDFVQGKALQRRH